MILPNILQIHVSLRKDSSIFEIYIADYFLIKSNELRLSKNNMDDYDDLKSLFEVSMESTNRNSIDFMLVVTFAANLIAAVQP